MRDFIDLQSFVSMVLHETQSNYHVTCKAHAKTSVVVLVSYFSISGYGAAAGEKRAQNAAGGLAKGGGLYVPVTAVQVTILYQTKRCCCL